MKVTVPRLESALESWIDWLMALVSVVPHQLLGMFMSVGQEEASSPIVELVLP